MNLTNRSPPLQVGGWWSVGAMVGVAYICYWTGVLLIECLYDKGEKIRFSYRDVSCYSSSTVEQYKK